MHQRRRSRRLCRRRCAHTSDNAIVMRHERPALKHELDTESADARRDVVARLAKFDDRIIDWRLSQM